MALTLLLQVFLKLSDVVNLKSILLLPSLLLCLESFGILKLFQKSKFRLVIP